MKVRLDQMTTISFKTVQNQSYYLIYDRRDHTGHRVRVPY